jgi:Mrp family chromosome partitioning ATPase/capsular polysaccharide biosynthesis protein
MNTTTDATAIFAPIWRRKWLILIVAVLVAGGTYLYYKRQPTLFQSTTQLYLGAGSEELLSEKSISSKSLSINASTQPAIINSIVLELARKQLRKEHTHIAKAAAAGKMRAKSAEKSQFVTITTEAHLARAAALLANTVAQIYIKRQHAQYQRGVKQSIAIARRQLRKVEAAAVPTSSKGKSSKSVSGISSANVIRDAQLSTKINQLEALLAVTAVEQVKPAKTGGAELLAPKPKSNAIFGFVIGLVLAAIAAFAVSRFDRRLRSLDDIRAVLGTEVLTALPEVKRPIIHRDGEPVPSKPLLEPLRRLHTTLQLGGSSAGQPHGSPRSILFLSADAGDGKSTLVANLALVEREAGERTAVIEADFRRPVQGRLLGLSGPQGLVEVLTGKLSLGDGMQPVASLAVAPPNDEPRPGDGLATAVARVAEVGSVSVLVGAPTAANPPALLGSAAMSEVIRSLAEDHDRVLIDAPPPLEVSDALPLLTAVEAIVIVVRMGHTREASAQRLRELLDRTPAAPVVGAVANGVARKDIEKYGTAAGGRAWPARLLGR